MTSAAPIEQVPVKSRYFIVHGDRRAYEWNAQSIHDPVLRDARYFARVLLACERWLTIPNLRFYITFTANELPEYGPEVVAIFLGDEVGRVPRYFRHVRAVVRVYDSFPYCGVKRWWPVTSLKVLLLIKYFRNLVLHYRSRWRAAFPPSDWPEPVRNPLLILAPLGYARLEDVPMKTMMERKYHSFFAGNVRPGQKGWRRWIDTPKEVGRRAMLQAVERLRQSRPDFRFDGGVTDQRVAGEIGSYSERMMNAKICLAPRGSVVESFRWFEGLKFGCLVISERLPKRWYYEGAPVIQIDDWNELEAVIAPYLQDDAKLEQYRLRSLEYWNRKCSEEAFGRYLANCLNTGTVPGK